VTRGGFRSGGTGAVRTTLGRSEGRVAWDAPHEVLLAFAGELHDGGIPLCEEFAEMILVQLADDKHAVSPSLAVAELFAEPMTAAESVSTLVLATAAARARDAGLDDESLLRLMALATVFAARFESYLAERGTADRA
jgi:hypothetical protein